VAVAKLNYSELDWAETCATPLSFGTALSGGKWHPYRHLQVLDSAFLRLIFTDEADVLIVELPVRHGKSFYISKWAAAWYLTRWPDRTVAVASYGADFAAGWGRKTRDVLEEHSSFLQVAIDPGSSAAAQWAIEGAEGGMWTAGVGGPIVGKGYHLGIIDDPFKSMKEARSQTIRDAAWEWWQGTWLTREEPGVKRVIVMSRWHEDDLVGRLEEDPQGLRLRRLRLPALAEEDDPLGRVEGEALCPERYTAAKLEQFRLSRGAYTFAAQYQQSPIALGGQMLDPSLIGRFQYVDGGCRCDTGQQWAWQQLRTFTVVDFAITEKTSSDWTVAMTIAVTPEGFCLIRDVERVRIASESHVEFLFRVWRRMHPDWIGIEEGLAGTPSIEAAIRNGLPVRPLKTGGVDKVTRAESIRTMLGPGRIFARADAPWLDVLLREIGAFDKGRYDDQVDTLAYGCDVILRGLRGKRGEPGASFDPGVAHRAEFGRRQRRIYHPVMGRL